MASASDQQPTAAPAAASSAPSPIPTPTAGHSQTGVGDVGTSKPSIAPLGNSINGINSSKPPTPSIAGNKSPLAQIVSDIPAAGPSSTSAAPLAAPSASASPSLNNFAIRPSTNVSPVLPSTPGTPAQTLPPKGGTQQAWALSTPQNQIPSSTPVQGPGTGKPSPPSRRSVGFPSPKSEALQTDPKFIDDCNRLKFGIQQALPDAVRRSVRDNWETCLTGSSFHQAFVLNASIHHATPAAVQRGMRDFGGTLIRNARTAIMEQMTTYDLDQVADLILSKASVAFFDKCMEMRLKTIDAKRLINALARAERLGYDPSDVQEEEEVVVNAPVPLPQPQAPPSQSSPAMPNPGLLHYFGEPTKAYLVRKPAVSTPSSGPRSHTPIPVPSIPSHVAIQGSSPVTPSTSKTASPVPAPAPASSPKLTGDPYAHLSPEQLAALQSELREAEVTLTERMRQADLIVDPIAKKAKIESLSNSYGTKQSIIRKKYGVRLRQRRTRTEIQHERDRIQYKTASEIQADMGIAQRGPGRPSLSSPQPQPEAKSTATGGAGWASVNQPIATLASNVAVPASQTPASNNVSMHGPGKRRFSGGGEASNKRVAYGEMGGLGGSNLAEAATMDPTLPKSGAGTREEPMAVDDSSSESDDSSSDSSDEDIPAELPASVKQTLVRSSPAGGESRSAN
ncbi:hypothetical protein N0V82_004281 [Gnomoniopsis sp. IMI 355080]|nr:hypothetical protein N0V82_004281 [Gnomoniopsis sp. IMI 355080]